MIALTLLKTYWKPIAIGITCIGLGVVFVIAKHRYDVGHEAIGAARVQALWDADKAARIKAVSDQVALWDATRQKYDKAIEERDREHALRISEVNALANHLPPSVAAVVVPRAAIRVLDAAVRDTGAAARSSGKATDRVSVAAKPADH